MKLVDEVMNRAWKSRAQLKDRAGYTAAKDVRRWVSPDPGEDFARELAAVAGDGREMV